MLFPVADGNTCDLWCCWPSFWWQLAAISLSGVITGWWLWQKANHTANRPPIHLISTLCQGQGRCYLPCRWAFRRPPLFKRTWRQCVLYVKYISGPFERFLSVRITWSHSYLCWHLHNKDVTEAKVESDKSRTKFVICQSTLKMLHHKQIFLYLLEVVFR